MTPQARTSLPNSKPSLRVATSATSCCECLLLSAHRNQLCGCIRAATAVKYLDTFNLTVSPGTAVLAMSSVHRGHHRALTCLTASRSTPASKEEAVSLFETPFHTRPVVQIQSCSVHIRRMLQVGPGLSQDDADPPGRGTPCSWQKSPPANPEASFDRLASGEINIPREVSKLILKGFRAPFNAADLLSHGMGGSSTVTSSS